MDVEYKNVNTNEVKWKLKLRQVMLCSLTSLSSLTSGLSMGAPTVIIPQLRKETNSTEVSSEDLSLESWASSALSFAGAPWIVVLIILAHIFGRRISLLFTNICSVLAFLLCYLSTDIKQIIVSQAMLGITAATVKTLNIMVATEYTTPNCRGIFLTFQAASYFWGIWISNALGTFFNWTSIALFGVTSSICMFIFVVILPESPYWLASKNRFDQCAVAHRWIKGVDHDSERELDLLISDHKANNHKPKCVPFCSKIWEHIKNVAEPEVYKPILCCMLICGLYDWSGKLAYTVYAIDMLKKITNSERTAYSWMLILDGITVFGMYLACGLTKIMKRRTLLLSASVVCLIFLSVMSLYLYLIRLTLIIENNYVTMVLLIGYSMSICCGPLIMISILYGEFLPVHHSAGVVMIAVYTKITIGVFLKVTPYMFIYFGLHGTFLIFLIGYSILLYLCYKYLPETKNKTLLEITQFFKQTPKNTRELKRLKEYDT